MGGRDRLDRHLDHGRRIRRRDAAGLHPGQVGRRDLQDCEHHTDQGRDALRRLEELRPHRIVLSGHHGEQGERADDERIALRRVLQGHRRRHAVGTAACARHLERRTFAYHPLPRAGSAARRGVGLRPLDQPRNAPRPGARRRSRRGELHARRPESPGYRRWGEHLHGDI